MDDPSVVVDTVGQVRWLRLNRPDRLNALNPALMECLGAAIVQAESDTDIHAIVLTGNGRAFCSGGDLTNFRDHLTDSRFDDIIGGIEVSSRALNRLAACSKPVIAAVNGVAVAGGLETILCCDIVVAAEGALIGDGHLTYGVLPGGGGSVRLVRKLPPNVAKWLLMTGSLVPAERFAEWGLVNEVVPLERLVPRAQEIAESVAALSPLALAHVKAVADYAMDGTVESALKFEREAFARYVRSHDFAEGVAAFAERRRPRFEGR